ncbi:MAG TPA: S-layer protein domain-containing protein [Candidatus Methanoperedens sp.]
MTVPGAHEMLLNGTSIYLATGESEMIAQGYVLSLKSVGTDGSVWLQLKDDDLVVKSEIVHVDDYFIYNKTNFTIISVKIENVYSGSFEQDLVALNVRQFRDLDKPVLNKTGMIPGNDRAQGNNSTQGAANSKYEPVIWISGFIFILLLFYVIRKLW